MNGMLSQAEQSSGPVPQTPPTGPTPASGAAGPGHPELTDEAIKLIYDERFDKMVEMFEKNGPEKFARSMAIAVNTVIDELEKRHGELGPEVAAEVGGQLFEHILTDMLTGGVSGQPLIEGVPEEQIAEALPAVLYMYQESRPNISKEDMQQVLMGVEQQAQQIIGQQPEAQNGDVSSVR